jgi:hypothetical protein
MSLTTTVARAFILALFILLGASVAAASAPQAKAQVASWDIQILIGGEGMHVSRDRDYCLMPSTMAIRPGNWVHLYDQSGNEIKSVTLVDGTDLYDQDPLALEPGESCSLVAAFRDIHSADGYLFSIVPDPVPGSSASLSKILVIVVAATEDRFRVFYNDEGLRQCDVADESPIRLGAAIQTKPEGYVPASGSVSSIATFDDSEYHEVWNSCGFVGGFIFPAKAATTEETIKEYKIAQGQAELP